MSRVGKKPVALPDKTKVQVSGDKIQVEGPKGKLEVPVPATITVTVEDGAAVVERPNDTREARSLHGLTRALLQNAVTGVSEGFKRELEINGTGYRAEAKGREVHFALGYSHPIVFPLPEGITATTPTPTRVILEGIDRQSIGMVAANMRGLRPPEPYKGKGVKYAEEHIRRKVGKTGA